MKTCITILLFLILSNLYCQTRFDTVDFNNVNFELLNELLLEKTNDERKRISEKIYIEHEVCSLSAQYQCEYMAFYNIVCHVNDFEFKSEKLVQIRDRINFFSKRTKKEISPAYEVCLMREYFISKKITYEKLSSDLIGQFMRSEPHKKCLLSRSTPKCKHFLNFASITRKKGEDIIKFYVTGLSGFTLN